MSTTGNKWIKLMMIFVGISGCFSVLFGAWFAHGGKAFSLDAQSSLATALQYQLIHTLALFSTLVWALNRPFSKVLQLASMAFIFGILCFSGGIYLKTIYNIAIIGKLTPFGGISLAVAWLLLALEGKKLQ